MTEFDGQRRDLKVPYIVAGVALALIIGVAAFDFKFMHIFFGG